MLKKIALITFILFFLYAALWAQEFGFGSFDEEDTSTSSLIPAVFVSGEVAAAIVGYLDEIVEGPEHIKTRDMFMFSGKLKFLAQSSLAQGVINLKLVPALVPVSIDEAYIGAFYKGFDISAGLKKVAWGKADQFGPLDIINMPDQSKIFIEMADNTNLQDVKIAIPVIHASYRFGMFSKIEGILLPSFEITSMAVSSAVGKSNDYLALVTGPSSPERWMPVQMLKLSSILQNRGSLITPDTSGLDYAQAGLRFTTTIVSADIGIQYFYGRMFQPAAKTIINLADPSAPDFNPAAPYTIDVEFMFNKYHQIGIDYAQVLAGFNVRAEAAANITEDLDGDDAFVYNPSIGWSFGFDRDLFLGINLNCQANGSVRLMDDKIGSSKDPFTPSFNLNPDFDIEADTSMTSTRLTAMLSKKFLRDELELRAAVVWGIEDSDYAIIPSLIWARDGLRAALSGGFFLGDSEGQLGQYNSNNFIKASLSYTF